jgi:beta-N-acetylhexosaminidase
VATVSIRRRRRLAAGAVGGLAAGAFALGAALGDGPAPRPEAAQQLSVAKLAGQRLVVGFVGTEPPAPLRRMIREGEVAGVILFSGNIPGRAAARRLIRRLQALSRPRRLRDPLLVMVDQEGGLVKRLSGAPTASAEQMGARGTAFSRRQGRRTAANLRDVGFNVDLAPVLDVGRSGGVIEETDRSFGSSPARVTETAVPFAAALQAGGVAATAKHFPGLGAARENTDFAVQRIRLSRAALRRVDEAPYRRFVAADGALVMVSSAIYPAFSGKPASLSRPLAVGELRRRLGFDGVSITDALGGAAIRAVGGPARVGVGAARAGMDLLLYSDYRDGARAYRALRRKLRAGEMRRANFEASVQRVLTLRHRLRGG